MLTPTNENISGQTFKVALHGSLSKDVEEGAYYHYRSKLGPLTFRDETHNVCDDNYLDVECPQKKKEEGDEGDVVWESKDIMLAASIPRGQWYVEIDAYTAAHESLLCVRAHVAMGYSSSVELDGDAAFRVQA
jgi:hypothetical protein